MKAAVPLGAVLLIGLAIALHRSAPPDPGVRSARSNPSLRGETAAEPLVPLLPPVPGHLPQESGGRGPQAVSKTGPVPAFAWKKLSGRLERELSLTTVQQPAVEAVLKIREDEIRECHDAIRRSGVLDMRHYEWQVGVMKAAWFKRIDSLLDTVQHHRFVVLVEQGFFNEGLAFTHEPGMTVLE
jgi:hypothetical protein